MRIFHHLWASTEAAPDIGGIGVRILRAWHYFSKMNGIFSLFFGALCSKGDKGDWADDVTVDFGMNFKNIWEYQRFLMSLKSY